ncbi:MAG: hypothetical protein Q8L06_15885 [Pseudohongiella sp.]|nr:hypothetical protein [Pseudohongiella sp.]
MLEWFARIELSVLSTAVREIWWIFPTVLVIHSLSMAMMAGFGVVISLRAIGFVASAPMASLRRYTSIFWTGLAAAACSGMVLLIAYPAKALTNPLFYLKLLMLYVASWLSLQLSQTRWASETQTRLALLSMAAWFAVIIAGRFLAYTHSVLMASWLVSPAGG